MASSGPEGRGGWAEIARKEAAVEPKVDIPSLLSNAGLKTVVVDANALIGGGVKLAGIADQFFTIREVLDEVRDPASRFHLATLPVSIRCLEPSDEALAAVTKFSRSTGDFQSLSMVDLKLIALTYTFEAQVHGTAHIRTRPPPLVVTPSSTRRQREPPGWGTVDNPEEWEGIEEEEPSGAENPKSRILGLKLLNLDLSQSGATTGSPVKAMKNGGNEEREFQMTEEETQALEKMEDLASSTQTSVDQEAHTMKETEDSDRHSEYRRPRKDKPNAMVKQPPILDGKNVAEGVNASNDEVNEDGDDWQRASSRSTRRKYLKREAKRSARRAAESAELPYSVGDEKSNCGAATVTEERTGDTHLSNSRSDLAVATNEYLHVVDCATSCDREEDEGEEARVLDDEEEDIRLLDDRAERGDDDASVDDIGSNGDASSFQINGVESEESWSVGPLWKSSIACMTGDYAMQNVLLQMGLRLLSTSGMHIRELNKWVLKCQACNHVTSDVGRIFCPKCGNGGTLFKLSVTVGQNGTVHAGRTRRINLRGTRYSLPMPKGGRDGAAQNPILREDQLPNKLLHPRAKKATDLDIFSSSDVIFTVVQEKKVQKLAGVKSAAAIFGGRRNPNERRGFRKH